MSVNAVSDCGRSVVFSGYSPVSYTNKTNHHDITEILLKVVLNTITLILFLNQFCNIIIDRSRCLEWVINKSYFIPLTYQGPWWSYGSWIYNYLCNQCLSPLMLWVRILSGRCVQHYVIKFVSDLRLVSGFLWVLQFPPPIKLTAKIQEKYCWKWH
jgi:hypothetical protein